MAELPSGTITFVFTDVEGSTRLWEEHPDAMRAALARHDEIVASAIASGGGDVVKTTGDGFHAVFASAHDAVGAALTAQVALEGEAWPDVVPLRVRIGVHTGEAQLRDGDYYGSSTNRAARLMGVGHGGQILVSATTAALVSDELPDDVDLVPLGEHRLRDLAEPIAVFQLAAPDLARTFPPLLTLDRFSGNLPPQLSSFVGREREVVELAGMLQEGRCVTLTGVGGVGKTRLALQVAGEVVPRFRDGAWLAELAKVRDPGAVPEAVALTVGAPNRPDTPVIDTLTQYLHTKRMLLVLDNCEHVLDAAAELVRALEHACPHLIVLATSREGLGIRGEQLVAVRSLGEVESEQLFVGRATAVKHDFAFTEANATAVREVCRRLDGIPLAIELAAARVAALSPAQIAARLDQRFRLLAGGERGAIERHATLRAAIDWSYELLEPNEQLLLARLSVFAGGCTLDAAEAVCADASIGPDSVLDLVSSLVTRSLVVADTNDPAETVYRLLETIRQYAEEHLEVDDRGAVSDRHAAYYAQWLVTASDHLRGPDQVEWVARAERETENVRAAIAWALSDGNADSAHALIVAVTWPPLAFLGPGRVMWDHSESVLDLVRATEHEHLAPVVMLAAWVASTRGDADLARARCDEALDLGRGADEFVLMGVWSVQQQLALMEGDSAGAAAPSARLIDWARRTGATYDLAYELAGLAAQHANHGDVAAARVEATEALELARRTGAPSLITFARAALASALVDSDPDEARAHLRALAEPATLAMFADEPALATMMVSGARLDEFEATMRLGARILDVTPSSNLILGVVLEMSATVLASRRPQDAATLQGAVDAIVPGFADLLDLRAATDPLIDEALEPATVEQLRDRGRAMSEDEATAFVQASINDALALDAQPA